MSSDRAVMATYIAFSGSGFAFASWASRIPQVRDHLHLSPVRLGLVLLAIAAGSLVARPLAGPVTHRYGAGRTVAAMAALMGLSLVIVALGYFGGLAPVVAGLFLLGLSSGASDVAMNVHAAVVERHLGRSAMSRFHAGFSLGTVAGALVGAALVAVHIPVTAHLLAVAVLVAVLVPWGTRRFVEDGTGTQEQPGEPAPRSALAAWREPRTLLIGVFVLTFAFAEGAGNDWVGIATIDGHGTAAVVGTLAFAAWTSVAVLLGVAALITAVLQPVHEGIPRAEPATDAALAVVGGLVPCRGPRSSISFPSAGVRELAFQDDAGAAEGFGDLGQVGGGGIAPA
jgi:MFS family permease